MGWTEWNGDFSAARIVVRLGPFKRRHPAFVGQAPCQTHLTRSRRNFQRPAIQGARGLQAGGFRDLVLVKAVAPGRTAVLASSAATRSRVGFTRALAGRVTSEWPS
jgi:hypothetical protein